MRTESVFALVQDREHRARSLSSRIALLEDRLFSEPRLRFYATGIAAALAGVAAWKIGHGASVVDAAGRPACIDFCTTWVSGRFAASAEPGRIYDDAAFAAAQTAWVGPHHAGLPAYHFPYPPTFLLLTYPLGLLSYVTAFTVWNILTLLLYLASIYAILPRATAVIAALTPVVVAENVLLGQSGFLTAAIVGFSLALLERRPRLAGAILGVLTFKPHFGVLFPLALAASRNWRAFAAATATSIALCAAAAAAFGISGWPSFFAALRGRTPSLAPDPGLELTLQSVYGLLHWAGAGGVVAWAAHLAAAALLSGAVWALWSTPVFHSLRAALLAIAAVSATPYVQIYDLCMLPAAAAFLVRDGIRRGFLAGERIALVTIVASLFLLLQPLGAVIDLVLALLVLRRVAAFRRDRPAGGGVPGGAVLTGRGDG
jgi:arabinofuranan 3-O-arabinosyltransferase